jgi:hypothetical protein
MAHKIEPPSGRAIIRILIVWIFAGALAYFSIRCALDGDTRDALEIGAFGAIGFLSAIVGTRRILVQMDRYAADPPRNSN